MKNEEMEINSIVSVAQKGQLPVGVHLFLAIIFLVGAIVYTISPIDFIPDVLGPIGWIDDIMVWVIAIILDLCIIRKRSARKLGDRQQRTEQNGSFI